MSQSQPLEIVEIPLPKKGSFQPKLEPFQFLASNKHELHVDWQNFNYRLKKFRLPCKVEDNLPLLPSDGDAFIAEEYIENWPDVFAKVEYDKEFLHDEVSLDTIRGLVCQMKTEELEEEKEQEYFENQEAFHFKDTIFHMKQTYGDYKEIPKAEDIEVWDEETLEDMLLADEAEKVEKEVHLPKYLERDLFGDVKHFRFLDHDYIEETIVKQLKLSGVEIRPLDELLKEGLERVEIVPPDNVDFDICAELDKTLKVKDPWIPDPESIVIENIFDETDEEYILDLVIDSCYRAVWRTEQKRNEDKDDTIDEIVDQYLDQIDVEKNCNDELKSPQIDEQPETELIEIEECLDEKEIIEIEECHDENELKPDASDIQNDSIDDHFKSDEVKAEEKEENVHEVFVSGQEIELKIDETSTEAITKSNEGEENDQYVENQDYQTNANVSQEGNECDEDLTLLLADDDFQDIQEVEASKNKPDGLDQASQGSSIPDEQGDQVQSSYFARKAPIQPKANIQVVTKPENHYPIEMLINELTYQPTSSFKPSSQRVLKPKKVNLSKIRTMKKTSANVNLNLFLESKQSLNAKSSTSSISSTFGFRTSTPQSTPRKINHAVAPILPSSSSSSFRFMTSTPQSTPIKPPPFVPKYDWIQQPCQNPLPAKVKKMTSKHNLSSMIASTIPGFRRSSSSRQRLEQMPDAFKPRQVVKIVKDNVFQDTLDSSRGVDFDLERFGQSSIQQLKKNVRQDNLNSSRGVEFDLGRFGQPSSQQVKKNVPQDNPNSSTGVDFDLGRFAQPSSQPSSNAWNFNFASSDTNQDFNFPPIRQSEFNFQDNFQFAAPKIPPLPLQLHSQDSISDMVKSGQFNSTLNDTQSSVSSIPKPIKKIKKKLNFQFEW